MKHVTPLCHRWCRVQVLDVTSFLSEHPGGELAILTFAGCWTADLWDRSKWCLNEWFMSVVDIDWCSDWYSDWYSDWCWNMMLVPCCSHFMFPCSKTETTAIRSGGWELTRDPDQRGFWFSPHNFLPVAVTSNLANNGGNLWFASYPTWNCTRAVRNTYHW